MSTEHITLPTIQASLGIPMTGDFIERTLHVAPVATDKRAKFWTREQYDQIRRNAINFLAEREGIVEATRAPKPPKSGNAPAPSPAASSTAPGTAPVYEDDDEI